LLVLKWQLALATFIIVPIMLILSTRMRRGIRRGWQRVRIRLSRINAHLNEAIQGMRVTQAFVREAQNQSFFNGINYDYYTQWMTTQRNSALFSPLVNVTGAVGTAIVFFYGALLVRDGQIAVGTVVGFLQYVTQFWQPISLLGQLYNSLLQAMASSERIFQFLDFRPDVTSEVGAPPLPKVTGAVEFDHVAFRYGDGPEVLSDISFRVLPGQTVALVGHTGAGKTTIVSLLARFYDPTAGAIRIDGHDLREVSLQSLRSQIGMVIQETFLFSGTIGTNLQYGRLAATLKEIEHAAREAGMHDFVHALPQGYGTEVQERGGRLSAGQRQLLAIARALLADPRILILDEATSSIDTHTEMLVQTAIGRLLENRTAFVVAHRLSTIRRADQILVFDHGRIVESGTHESLIAKDGFYAGLLRAQFRFLDDLAPTTGRARESAG
jgi:ATP-binding cassette subfamily B protein